MEQDNQVQLYTLKIALKIQLIKIKNNTILTKQHFYVKTLMPSDNQKSLLV